MFIKNALEELEKSETYKEWRKSHPKSFHSYCFLAFEDDQASDWQIGYYNEDDTISTFEFKGSTVKEATNDKVFKHPGAKVYPLDMNKVKLNVEEVIESVEEIRKKKYSAFVVIKTLMILQFLKEYGTVWNVTLVTTAFETINVKLDASTGKVRHDEKVNLIQKE